MKKYDVLILDLDNTIIDTYGGAIKVARDTVENFARLSGVPVQDIMKDLQALAAGDDWMVWHERKHQQFDAVLRDACPSVQRALAQFAGTDRGDALNEILDSWDARRKDAITMYRDQQTGRTLHDIWRHARAAGIKVAIHTDAPLSGTVRLLLKNGISAHDLDLVAAVDYADEQRAGARFMKLSPEERAYIAALEARGRVLRIPGGQGKPNTKITHDICKKFNAAAGSVLMVGDKHLDWGTTRLAGHMNIAAAHESYNRSNARFAWARYGACVSARDEEFYRAAFSGDKRQVGENDILRHFAKWKAQPDHVLDHPEDLARALGLAPYAPRKSNVPPSPKNP